MSRPRRKRSCRATYRLKEREVSFLRIHFLFNAKKGRDNWLSAMLGLFGRKEFYFYPNDIIDCHIIAKRQLSGIFLCHEHSNHVTRKTATLRQLIILQMLWKDIPDPPIYAISQFFHYYSEYKLVSLSCLPVVHFIASFQI